MRGLENRAHANRELLTASTALFQAKARLGEVVDRLLAPVATVRADRAFGPYDLLKLGKGRFFVVKVGF